MKQIAFLSTVLLLLLSLQGPAKAEDTDSIKLVRGFYTELENTMKEGPKLGFEGRYKKLEPIIAQTFDMPLMTKYAVGPSWRAQSEEDQQKLITAFARFSTATYASRFTKYDGELFEVLSEKPLPNGNVMVETHLTPKGESPVILNYLVRTDKTGTPRLMDVYLDASISELATRRSEFAAVIKRDGFNALAASLNEKADKMALPPKAAEPKAEQASKSNLTSTH